MIVKNLSITAVKLKGQFELIKKITDMTPQDICDNGDGSLCHILRHAYIKHTLEGEMVIEKL